MASARRYRLPRRRSDQAVVGVLDIGTAKICCMIAEMSPVPRLIGLGHQRSRGISCGIVVNFEEAEQAIRAAVAQAERQAGVTLDAVRVSVTGGQPASLHFAATAGIATGAVTDADLARLDIAARQFCERDGRRLVHLNHVAYRLDDFARVPDPRGMAGRMLAGDIHAVTADDGPVENLVHLVERCLLKSSALVPAGLASARAVASEEELNGGVTVVDMGAGTTSIGIACEGHDVFAATIPIGGQHLTYDLAAALGTPVAEAERIKVLYGTMVEASSDGRDFVTYPRPNEDGAELYETTRAEVRNILRPRVESLLSQVRDRLVDSGLEAYGGGRIVLTGGAAQLVGLPMFAGRFLGRAMRVASPRPLAAMSSSASSPALATAIGMIVSAADPGAEVARPGLPAVETGYLGRVGQWLRDAF